MMELDKVWSDLQAKVDSMMDQIGHKSPHVAAEGKYDDARLDWWTSGFWPGMLWIMYDATGGREVSVKGVGMGHSNRAMHGAGFEPAS